MIDNYTNLFNAEKFLSIVCSDKVCNFDNNHSYSQMEHDSDILLKLRVLIHIRTYSYVDLNRFYIVAILFFLIYCNYLHVLCVCLHTHINVDM